MIAVADYNVIQDYSGEENEALLVTHPHHYGLFTYSADEVLPDNGSTILRDAKKRCWKRVINDGNYNIDWWFAEGDENDYALTINRACEFLAVEGREWSDMAIPSTPVGITLTGPGGVRQCQSSVLLKLWKNSIDFKGTLLDFSAARNLECVRVLYSAGAPAIYNLKIVGNNSAESNLRGLAIYSDAKNMSGIPVTQLLVQNIWLANFEKGIVFGDNAYIQSWHSIIVTGCTWPIWSESKNNAGEKIVFYKSLFGNGRSYYQGVHTLSFYDCSFDYSGFSTEEDQLINDENGLFDLKGGQLTFQNCHFEWGNEHSRNARPVFTSNNGGIVKIIDCEWHSVKTNSVDPGKIIPYQLVNYFYYDRSVGLTGKFYVDGFDLINTDLKQGWSNNHVEMKAISAPGHINMFRQMYLGDGVNHLPEPNWQEKNSLFLNNVYATGGNRISQFETTDLKAVLNSDKTITVTTSTIAGQKSLQLFFPIQKDDLVLWRVKLENLVGQDSIDVSISTHQGRYDLSVVEPETILEKTCQWVRKGTLPASGELVLTSDRITALHSSEYLPLPEAYMNYARVDINFSKLSGSSNSPTSVDITAWRCQRVNIKSRNESKAWEE